LSKDQKKVAVPDFAGWPVVTGLFVLPGAKK
jgi:hypothetical protein